MIDRAHQGQGIGKKAAKMMINVMRNIPNTKKIAAGYHPDNKGSHKLWRSLGFKDNGDRFGREMAVVLDL